MIKNTILAMSLVLWTSFIVAQQKEKADELVEYGIAYHDKGDYKGAISKYDSALAIDSNNFLALAEKAMTLLSLQEYDESIIYCQKAIKLYPESYGLRTVYVTYGNDLDMLKQTDKSIEIYNEGISKFPDFYQLYFNKGITLASINKYDQAILSFQKSAAINPKHASSHNAIGRISKVNNQPIPALLAFCRFFTLEQTSTRAIQNLGSLQDVMKGSAEKTGKKSITISISPELLGDTTASGTPNENSFTTIYLLMSMQSALNLDKKNKKKSEVELFSSNFSGICSSLKETQSENYGFYWDYYVPYFIEMNDMNLVETFSYFVFASSDDPKTAKWIKSHSDEINVFFTWSNSFVWESN